MREIGYGARTYTDLSGREHHLEYRLVAEGVLPRRYGVAVRDVEGETVIVRDVTTQRRQAEELLARLEQGLVTPVALRDVVEDLIGT